jgi:hypothetical protein
VCETIRFTVTKTINLINYELKTDKIEKIYYIFFMTQFYIFMIICEITIFYVNIYISNTFT